MDVIELELETTLIARKRVDTSSCHEVPLLGAIRLLEGVVAAAVVDVAIDMVPKWQCPGRRRFLDVVFKLSFSNKSEPNRIDLPRQEELPTVFILRVHTVNLLYGV